MFVDCVLFENWTKQAWAELAQAQSKLRLWFDSWLFEQGWNQSVLLSKWFSKAYVLRHNTLSLLNRPYYDWKLPYLSKVGGWLSGWVIGWVVGWVDGWINWKWSQLRTQLGLAGVWGRDWALQNGNFSNFGVYFTLCANTKP